MPGIVSGVLEGGDLDPDRGIITTTGRANVGRTWSLWLSVL